MYVSGAIPSIPDTRDYRVAMFVPVQRSFPHEFTCSHLPDVYNQGGIGSCVAFTLAEILESVRYKETGNKVRISPGFIYGNRYSGDYTGEGMMPNQALSALRKDGAPSYERMSVNMPYPVCYEIIKNNPTLKEIGKPQRIASYIRLNNNDEIRTALQTMGPVAMMIGIYNSFYSSGGVVPQVGLNETLRGYHLIMVYGWEGAYFKIQNSWGTTWGSGGRALLPMDYKGVTESWGVTDMVPVKREIVMDVPMKIDQGRTMTPIRFIVEALGGLFDYSKDKYGKMVVTAVVPPNSARKVIELVEGSNNIKTYDLD